LQNISEIVTSVDVEKKFQNSIVLKSQLSLNLHELQTIYADASGIAHTMKTSRGFKQVMKI